MGIQIPRMVRIFGGEQVLLSLIWQESFATRSGSKTVRYIFHLAAQGIGSTRIVDKLNAENIPAWTRTKRWSAMYVGELLRSRHVLGEYQPGTHPRGGVWTADGDPIPGYYPRIIDDALWAKVQSIRASNFARGKVPVGKFHGKGGRSNWRNLFLGILFDEDGNTMIYKQVQQQWAYLVSFDRSKFKTHKIRYAIFQEAMLALLHDLDWAAITNSSDPKLKAQSEELNSQIAFNRSQLLIVA